jgi:hypothetical protein
MGIRCRSCAAVGCIMMNDVNWSLLLSLLVFFSLVRCYSPMVSYVFVVWRAYPLFFSLPFLHHLF